MFIVENIGTVSLIGEITRDQIRTSVGPSLPEPPRPYDGLKKKPFARQMGFEGSLLQWKCPEGCFIYQLYYDYISITLFYLPQ